MVDICTRLTAVVAYKVKSQLKEIDYLHFRFNNTILNSTQ